ncbi:hypothetical protein ACIPK5_30765 [Streptomyces sp. NPDC086843]|uniref:hypothetical protein n=1 Tax=Streptomyces sp. NPDC086843 TaxID=3365763 RepID=UPI0038272971
MTIDSDQFRRDGHRIEKWSVGWMLLSLAMWAWFGYRWLTNDDQGFGRQGEDSHALVGILALAVVPTIIAAATTAYAQVMFRLARQKESAVG